MVPAVSSGGQAAWDGNFRAWAQLERTDENRFSKFQCTQHVGGLLKRHLGPQKGPSSWGSSSWAEAEKVSASTRPSQPAQHLPFPPWQEQPVPMLSSSQQQNPMLLAQFRSQEPAVFPSRAEALASGGVLGRWASRIPMQGSPPAEMTCPSKQLVLGPLPDRQPKKAHDSSGIQLTLCPHRPYTSEFFHVSGRLEELWAWRLVSDTFCGG